MKASLVIVAILLLVGAAVATVWIGTPWTATSDHPQLIDTLESYGHETKRITATPAALVGLADGADTIVVLGAAKPYHQDEVAAVKDFVESGGTLIVADESGAAGGLLTPFGMHFERAPVITAEGAPEISFEVGDATYRLEGPIPATVYTTNPDAIPISTTADNSFVDRDQDGEVGPHDPPGPHTIAMQVDAGDGRVIAVGSVDLLNDPPENAAAWHQDFFDTAGHGRVYVDDSHHGDHGLRIDAMAAVIRSLQLPPASIAIIAAATATGLILAWRGGHRQQPWAVHQHDPDAYRPRRLAADTTPLPIGARDAQASAPPSRGFTRRGALTAAASIVLVGVGLTANNHVATWAGITLATFPVLALWTTNQRLVVQRNASTTKCPENTEISLETRIRAPKAARIELRDGVPDQAMLSQGSNHDVLFTTKGSWSDLAYRAKALVRGPFDFGPLRIRCTDPLAMRFMEACVGDVTHVDIIPRKELIDASPITVRRPELLLGNHRVHRAGEGSEFHALRDYQSGDPLRTVNWKASARSKGLMVNQRVHESQTRLRIIVDGRAIADVGPVSQTPLAVSARIAATLVDGAVQARDRVDVTVYGVRTTTLPSAPSQEFRHNVDTLLATYAAQGRTTLHEAVTNVAHELRSGTAVVILSGLEDDDTVPIAIKRLVAQGTNVTLLAPELIADDQEPDRDEIVAKRQDAVAAARRAGAVVFETQAGVDLATILRAEAR